MSQCPSVDSKSSSTNSTEEWRHDAAPSPFDVALPSTITLAKYKPQSEAPSISQTQSERGHKGSASSPEDPVQSTKGKRIAKTTIKARFPAEVNIDAQALRQTSAGTQDDSNYTTDAAQKRQSRERSLPQSSFHFSQLPERLGYEPTPNRREEDKVTKSKASAQKHVIVKDLSSDGRQQDNVLWFKAWTGDGIEDELTEQALKDGFAFRQQVVNELATAKPSLLPHIKNSGGLANLSQLYLFAITERRKCRAVTTSSNFKPPPRVTLTDARKTAWFVDLANSLVSLRRLSRTIPHGIRGRLLLDLCLSHQVPVSRALWLAKCVGANEMRAFRRKGVNSDVVHDNEQRWIQNWTLQVSEFLWTGLNGQSAAGALHYAVQLVACIYAEDMIDQSQFIDDILSGIGGSSATDLALHLGVLQTWLPEILSSHRHCVKLAITSMDLYAHPEVNASEKSEPLINAVKHLVTLILTRVPRALASLPNLRSAIAGPVAAQAAGGNTWARENIQRDQSQIGQLIHGRAAQPIREVDRIIMALDHCMVAEHRQYLLELSSLDDPEDALTTILKWASTRYRARKGASSIAVILVSRLCYTALSAKQSILRFTIEAASSSDTSPSRLGALVAALTSSGLFDISAYMRALVASGAMYGDDDESSCLQCHTSILRALPIHEASTQACAMRTYLLRSVDARPRRTSHSTDQSVATEQELPTLWAKWHELQSTHNARPATNPPSALDLLGSAVATLSTNPKRLRLASDDEARTLCTHLQQREDSSSFKGLLSPIVRSANCSVLASVAQLVCAFQGALAFTSQFDALRDLLIERYRALRLRGPSNREVLLALKACDALEAWQQHYLESEMRLCEQTQCVTANTPASEILMTDAATPHAPESMQLPKSKCDSGLSVTMTCVERLVIHADRTEAVSVSTLQAANALLTDRFIQGVAVGKQSLLLIKLLAWIIRNLGHEHSGASEEILTTCCKTEVKDLLVEAIINHEEVTLQILSDIVQPKPSLMSINCVYQLAINLIKSPGVAGTKEASNGTPLERCNSLLDTAEFLQLVDTVLMNSSELSIGATRVGLAVIAKLHVRMYPNSVGNLQSLLQSRVEEAIKSGQQLWAQATAALPQELDVLSHIQEQAEEILFARAEAKYLSNSLCFNSFDIAGILEVIIEADSSTSVKVSYTKVARRIIAAIRCCMSSFVPQQAIKLEALLSVSLLHHPCFDHEPDRTALVSLLCLLLADQSIVNVSSLHSLTFDTIGFFVTQMTQREVDAVVQHLSPPLISNFNIRYLLGIRADAYAGIRLRTATSKATSRFATTLAAFNLSSDDPTEPPQETRPFKVRRWEILPDTGSKEGENDTPLEIRLFGTRILE